MTETIAHMGTHLRAISESYPMNTNMTGFRSLRICVPVLRMKVVSALEGLTQQIQSNLNNTRVPSRIEILSDVSFHMLNTTKLSNCHKCSSTHIVEVTQSCLPSNSTQTILAEAIYRTSR